MSITTPEELGTAVRSARLSQAWSQEDLAARIGVTREWIGRLERGAPRLELDKVLSAANALGFALHAPTGIDDHPRAKRISPRSRRLLMSEIEKGQQLAGHRPSGAALERAMRVLEGAVTEDSAIAEVDAKYGR